MRFRVFFELRDNDYYQDVEADSKKQARGRFACRAVKDETFKAFIGAIKAIKSVEETKE